MAKVNNLLTFFNSMHYHKLISLPLLMGVFVLAGCTQTQTTDTTNEITGENANVEVAVDTNTGDESGEVNVSDWKIFSDTALGIKFSYPNNYTIAEDELIDFSDSSKYDQDIYAGKSRRLVVQSKEDLTNQVTLIASTNDRKNVYAGAFTGGDLSSHCSSAGEIESGISYCNIVETDGKEFLYRNEFINMECSPRFNTNIIINNPNVSSDFSGLQFHVALPDIQKDLLSEPFKDNDPCAGNIDIDNKLQNYLETDFPGNNLSTLDKNLFEVMKKIVQSVEYL